METWEFKRSALDIPSADSPVINVSEFTFEAADRFIRRMSELEADQDLNCIFINIFSYGGEADPLLAMIDTVRHSSKEVHVIGLGLTCSAGAYFLTLGPDNARWMSENCLMQIHHTSTDMEGDARTLRRELDALEITDRKIFSMIASNSNLSMLELIEKIKEGDGEWLLEAKEAKEYGLIDHIGIPKIRRCEVWECEVNP